MAAAAPAVARRRLSRPRAVRIKGGIHTEPGLRLFARALRALSHVSPRLAGRVAFAAYRRPWGRAKVRPDEADVHASAVVEPVRLADGAEVVSYRWGDGKRPVLLVHGWGARGSRYAPYVSALLAHGFSPVAFDSPGHGDSAGRENTIVQDREIIEVLHRRHGRFHAVIGHSKGVVSVFYALRCGVTADKVVAISGPARYDQLAERLAGILKLTEAAHRDLRRRVAASFAPLTDVWTGFSPASAPPATDAPILLIHDEQDDLVAFSEAGLTAAAYAPRAELVATRGLGHRRILTDAEVVSRAVAFVAAS